MAELGIGSFWGGQIGGTVTTVISYAFYGVILAVVGFLFWKWYSDKKIYKNPVRILRQRQNGDIKEYNTRGGYIINKKKVTEFWIKLGRIKKVKMAGIPDPDLIDNEDRVYYFQISPTEYIQTKRELVIEPVFIKNHNFKEPTDEEAEIIIKKWAKELQERNPDLTEEDSLEQSNEIYTEWLEKSRGEWVQPKTIQIKPLNQATKESVVNDILLVKQTLGVDVNKQFLYFIGGAIALVVLGIVIFYMASNQGRLPLLEMIPFTLWKTKK